MSIALKQRMKPVSRWFALIWVNLANSFGELKHAAAAFYENFMRIVIAVMKTVLSQQTSAILKHHKLI